MSFLLLVDLRLKASIKETFKTPSGALQQSSRDSCRSARCASARPLPSESSPRRPSQPSAGRVPGTRLPWWCAASRFAATPRPTVLCAGRGRERGRNRGATGEHAARRSAGEAVRVRRRLQPPTPVEPRRSCGRGACARAGRAGLGEGPPSLPEPQGNAWTGGGVLYEHDAAVGSGPRPLDDRYRQDCCVPGGRVDHVYVGRARAVDPGEHGRLHRSPVVPAWTLEAPRPVPALYQRLRRAAAPLLRGTARCVHAPAVASAGGATGGSSLTLRPGAGITGGICGMAPVPHDLHSHGDLPVPYCALFCILLLLPRRVRSGADGREDCRVHVQDRGVHKRHGSQIAREPAPDHPRGLVFPRPNPPSSPRRPPCR